MHALSPDPGPLGRPSTQRRAWARPLVLGAALLDVALLAWAIDYGAAEVRDGAGSITNGYNVALSLGVTLAAALLLQVLRLPPALRVRGQLALLVGQALHALGHLARWYYVVPFYDDVLHFGIAAMSAFLLLRLAQAWDVFPSAHATPLRAALVVLVLGLAVAGGWEIFEFLMDNLQGTREQDDLTDTMADMVSGLFGAGAASLVAWRFPRPAS